MTAGGLTVLHAHKGKRMAKRFRVATIGTVAMDSYDKQATWFTAEPMTVAGVHDMHRLLLRLEGEPGACIIRGEPAPHVNLACTRKRKVENSGEFVDVPRQYLMLDGDGIPLEGYSVLSDPADTGRALLDAISARAPELEGVTAVVQFSSRAGLDEVAEGEALAGTERPGRWAGVIKPGVSAHIWFWLTRPLGEVELKRWAAAVNARAGFKLIDPMTLQTVQPHYTAAPVFDDGLRDPLAGRRTLLIEGAEDAADLCIPAEQPRQAAGGSAGTAHAGRGYSAYLAEIGGPDGFHAPIGRAVASFIATNRPHPDLAALKDDIRGQIAASNPGSRSAEEMRRYASDAYLDGICRWVMMREAETQAERQAERQAEAERPMAPSFPDRGVPLAVAQRQAAAAVGAFADRLRNGEAPEVQLRLTVGAGKSEATIAGAEDVLVAAHAGGREGALYYLVPRHDLGGEVVQRIAAAHAWRSVAVWLGMDRPDPEAPGKTMCHAPELPKLAAAAGLSGTDACAACPLRLQCGYWRQRGQEADIWIGAHNLAFQGKPSGLPPAAAVVLDESFSSAGLAGTDGPPIQMAVSTLLDERTGDILGVNRARLLLLRRMAASALAWMDEGGISRAALEAEGFTASNAEEWRDLEWMTKPRPGLTPGMDRSAIAERLREAAEAGFSTLRPMLAGFIAKLLAGTDARSVNAMLVRNVDLGRGNTGDAIRFTWRKDFNEWVKPVPKLTLDATTAPEVLRQWMPALEVVEIEVQAPQQHVRQVIGREFGRGFFTETPGNIGRLADLVTLDLAQAEGEVLVVAQKAVREALGHELWLRVANGRLPDKGDGMPARLHLAHHGNVTGMNAWEQVSRVVVVGRPATNRTRGEQLAEVIKGQAVETVSAEDSKWPSSTGGIRMADGAGRAVPQPYHPDAMVEAVRWSITEGAVLQAIGRGRGVRREVQVTLLGELALPLTVAEVTTWDETVPDRLTVAAAEAALMGRALPLAPADLARTRPEHWGSENAVTLDLKRARKGGQRLIGDTYKGLTPLSGQVVARYRKAGGRGSLALALVPEQGGEAALTAEVGPLSAYEAVTAEPAPMPQPANDSGVDDVAASPPAPAPVIAVISPPPSSAALRSRLLDLGQRLEAMRPKQAWGIRQMDFLAHQVAARKAATLPQDDWRAWRASSRAAWESDGPMPVVRMTG